jgi:NitT/TauT family transport system ATP-binding protein
VVARDARVLGLITRQRSERARDAARGPAAGPIIELDGVSKTFDGTEGAVVAVREIGLSVAPGELVSIIGPSGCGKSTLLRIVGDLVEPSTGVVRVNGKPPQAARLDRDYGIVFQTPVLYDWRTVLENVELPLELARRPRGERRERATRLLRLVGLEAFARHRPWQLSGGMQQRVAIARALALDPAILLMDEPFGALDDLTRERLNDELLRVCGETGATVLFVTHSLAEAVFLSSRVVVFSPRPGTIERIVAIDLPEPRGARTRTDPRFFQLITEVRASLREDPGLAR